MTKALIAQWIDELSQPNPKFGGEPTCRFAQKAWRQGDMEFEDCGIFLLSRLFHIVTHPIARGKLHLLSFNPEHLLVDAVDHVVEQFNTEYPHLLVLATHPDHDEPSHPTLGLVFIQRKADMIAAVDFLRTTAYYDNNQLPEWYTDANS